MSIQAFNPNRLSEAFKRSLQANQRVGGVDKSQEQQASSQVGAQNAFAAAALQFGSQAQPSSDLSSSQRVEGAGKSQGPTQTQFQPQQANPFQIPGLQGPEGPQGVQFAGKTDPLEQMKKFDLSKPGKLDGNFGPANYSQQDPYQQAAAQPNGNKLWAMA